jgi:branched-chain amino acid transport system ATP-binding protein
MALLETRQLTVSYGGVRANDSIDIDVERGTLVGLIGPNGAGKTTLIDAITGFAPITSGQVRFNSADITSAGPATRARAGLARTFQSLELFEDLTVGDNLAVAAHRPSWYSMFVDLVAPSRGTHADDAAWALEAMGLGQLVDKLPGALSHGQRKLVGIARALATRPMLLLLDEPAAGLDTSESKVLGQRLRGLLDHGITMLLIDHDMDLMLEVCDLVYVLDFGRLIASGPPAQIRIDPAVVSAYLGSRSISPGAHDA